MRKIHNLPETPKLDFWTLTHMSEAMECSQFRSWKFVFCVQGLYKGDQGLIY